MLVLLVLFTSTKDIGVLGLEGHTPQILGWMGRGVFMK